MKLSSVLILMVVLFSGPISAQMKSEHEKSISSDKATELKLDMRDLWQEHVSWTRNVILCIIDGLPGTDQAVNRLLKNQDEIGNAVKPFYGEEAGKQLSTLLREHITVAAEVVKAAKANDKTALDDANKRWYANADQIGEFLGKANPNWNAGEMKTMMHNHLKLLTEEVVSRIKKDYNADVASYDKSQKQISQMADMLAEGIVKQFPEKFKS